MAVKRKPAGCYYNDNDPFAAEWLRELIRQGHLPEGTVDERPIQEVRAEDLEGYRQHHFFCGIGGWPLALALVGWPATRPVWTGSCPCQPFSSAGKRKGEADGRHVWPHFLRLIRDCRPATCLGEQVSGRDGLRWLAGVRDDLEACGYAVGAADLPACSQGAPHIRQRLFWVADSDGRHAGNGELQRGGQHGQQPNDGGVIGRMGDAGNYRLGRNAGPADKKEGEGKGEGAQFRAGSLEPGFSSSTGFWSASDLIPCRDGKVRRVEPGSFPLAHGVPRRVGSLLATLAGMGVDPKTARRVLRNVRSRLAKAGRNRPGRIRGYGNAIVPQAAAAFVKAFLGAEADILNLNGDDR
jgi:DNA (cytosine-5)-methyltransferase 1